MAKRSTKSSNNLVKNKNRILILADLHAPWINWKAIKQAHVWAQINKPDLVVCLGDLTDQKVWSRWPKDVDDLSPDHELNLTIKALDKLHKLFPKMLIIRGNHDNRIQTKAIEAGIPSSMLKDIASIFKKPGWKWIPTGSRLTVETKSGLTLFLHGDETGGTVTQKSRLLGVNLVQGHTHKASITFTKTDCHHIYGAEMGCLLDVDSKAAHYCVSNPVGVSVGFGVIMGGIPSFIPFIP